MPKVAQAVCRVKSAHGAGPAYTGLSPTKKATAALTPAALVAVSPRVLGGADHPRVPRRQVQADADAVLADDRRGHHPPAIGSSARCPACRTTGDVDLRALDCTAARP